MTTNHDEADLPSNIFVCTVQSRRGFTLIELLIVVAIVGILATIAISGFSLFREKANVVKAREEIRGLEKEIIAYTADKAALPASLDDIGRNNFLDPWGTPYEYKQPCIRNFGIRFNTDFDLYSKGPDRASAASLNDAVSLDDVVRFNDGAFCDVAEKIM